MLNSKHAKTLALVGALATIVGFSFSIVDADARPSTRSFTCGGLKNFVADNGAVVMNHKSSSLYRRFVAHAGYCRSYGGSTRSFSVPTRTGRCRLKICYEPIRREFGRGLFGD